ncbi:MAG: YCF48-related protein [Terriglobales bacterium]
MLMAGIPKIVEQQLHAMAPVKDHLDPNLLGAFVEKSLAQGEQLRVLEHLSRCTSCREIVSLTAAQPGIAGAVSLAPARSGWLSWPVLRWGAAMACVVVVGVAVTIRQEHESRQIDATIAEQKAELEKQNSPPSSPPAKVAEQTIAANPTVTRQTARAMKPAENNKAAAASPVEMADAGVGSRLAEVPGRAKAAESQDAESMKATGNAVQVEGSTAPVVPLVSTNLPPRWTLSSDGTLQRSRDSGRSWQTIQVADNTIFRALAANRLEIWVGGAAGALFHSSDAGQHWTQVRPVANGEALADDIIGVEFTDTLHGKVTTSVQEIWITVDAGQTWQKQ